MLPTPRTFRGVVMVVVGTLVLWSLWADPGALPAQRRTFLVFSGPFLLVLGAAMLRLPAPPAWGWDERSLPWYAALALAAAAGIVHLLVYPH